MKSIFFVLFVAMFAAFSSAAFPKDIKCLVHREAGRCLAYIPSFAYDANLNECVPFVYGGCGGNDNRFETKEECEEDCKPE